MAVWNVVLGGIDPASQEIGRSLSKLIGAEYCNVLYKRFPDGEEYVRADCVEKGDGVIVVQTMPRPQSSMALIAMLLGDAAKEAGASRALLISPYLAFARQDRAFMRGEPVSVRSLLRALRASGYDALATVEIHKEDSLKHFGGNSYSVYPYNKLAQEAGVDCGRDVLVAPDLGALGRTERLARSLGCPYGHLVKERDRVTGEVRLREARVDVGGRRVIVVDDIVSTGGTLALASKALLEAGADSVEVIVAHYLGLQGVDSRLSESGVSRVVAAYTLPKVSSTIVDYVDISDLLAEVTRRVEV